MAQETYYIRLFNNNKPPNPTSVNNIQPLGFIPPSNNISSFSGISFIQPGSCYDFFLYNKLESGKNIKIKEYKFQNSENVKQYTDGARWFISRATTITTGSILSESVPFIKLNSNSPNLPSGIEYWSVPRSYTQTGSFFKTKTFTLLPQSSKFGGQNQFSYSNQSISSHIFRTSNIISNIRSNTNIQDITLRPNENLIIGVTGSGGGTYGASLGSFKFITEITILSGSDTYNIHDEIIGGRGGWCFTIGGLVNNSNTDIKVVSIDINSLYNGATNYNGVVVGDNMAASAVKTIIVEKITNVTLHQLDNPLYGNIIPLDINSTSSIQDIVCYKNCIYTDNYNGGDSSQYSNAVYRFKSYNNFTDFTNMIRSYAASVSPALETDMRHNFQLNDTEKTRYNYNKNGNEIIIKPGEGLGFLITTPNLSVNMGFGDVTMDGHVTFTVEDIPITPTGSAYQEVGFGF